MTVHSKTRGRWSAVGVAALLAIGLAVMLPVVETTIVGQAPSGAVTIDPDDIGGVVTSSKGPEAGVWVIAENAALETKLTKIVVTDDQGRYVLPDLPRGTYKVWVRGYGLVDSDPVQAAPGRLQNLTAKIAPTPQAAAQYYPANYWYSLLEIPKKSDFPGTGPKGNGINPDMKTQADWLNHQKSSCGYCHQFGQKVMREVPGVTAPGRTAPADAARHGRLVAAWDRRVQSGQRGFEMSGSMSRFGRERALEMFANWTARIADGEVPPAPPRPTGVERNLVLTIEDWGSPEFYVHDEVSTDKRKPTVNANGSIYGVATSNDILTVLDPIEHKAKNIPVPAPDGVKLEPFGAFPQKVSAPSSYYGEELIWQSYTMPHNPMIDGLGRVWVTSAVRNRGTASWCNEGSSNPYAKNFPIKESSRNASFYDPKTEKWTLIDTCFGTHHLQFAEDEHDTLYFSGGGDVIGWIRTKTFDQTKDGQGAQGWCPLVLDTSGDGRIGPYAGPGDAVDPAKDTRVRGGGYGIVPSPTDRGVVWVANPGPFPGNIIRLELGANPPATCKAELYQVPFNNSSAPDKNGYLPRGLDIDRNGVVWTALAGSGHMASFDRRKCKVLNGPNATGQHCAEGWTLYPDPGPTFKNAEEVNADFHYYNWVDQFNTLGLGENIAISAGSYSDSLLALDPKTGQWTVLRVPYPMGFFTRGMDGRIDDPQAGWKGRSVWATNAQAAIWHMEAGKGGKPKLHRFQIRPSPLAH